MSTGIVAGRPSKIVASSGVPFPHNTLGTRLIWANAASLAQSVTSSSAPPATKSNTTGSRCLRASDSSSRNESACPPCPSWSGLACMCDPPLLQTLHLPIEIAGRGIETDGDSFGDAAPHRRIQVERWSDDPITPITGVVLIAGHVDVDKFQLLSIQAQPLQTSVHAL